MAKSRTLQTKKKAGDEQPKGPANTVICCLCGKVVTKRKTFLVDSGQRACKTHRGVEKN